MLLSKLSLHARQSPDRVAVVAGQERLNYAELQQRAGEIASACLTSGIPKGALVAIFLGRTVHAISAIVGVMQAGMAYTVVEDDGHTEEAIFRLKTIAPALVIADDTQVAALSQANLAAVSIAKRSDGASLASLPTVTSSDLAYVLFTSGSTGTPKGVMITHGNLSAYTTAVKERLGVTDSLRYAHVSTLAADLGNTSLMLSLWTGGTLHLIDGFVRKDPQALFDYLASEHIQFLKITPSHWHALFKGAQANKIGQCRLEYLVLGGEALAPALAAQTLDSGLVRRLVNHYGPTETTVGVVANVFTSADDVLKISGQSVPIGTALKGVDILVRTTDGEFHHHDTIGELYIGGPSVSPGYFENPNASEKSFVTHGAALQRLYKTGDRVKIDADGVIEFLGRVDRQVKVNGYRVELEHVEAALTSLDGVASAAAVLLEVDGKSAIAAAVLTSAANAVTLKARLAKILPHYMVPKWIEAFAQFPLNANGKTHISVLGQQLRERLTGDVAACDTAGDANPSASIRLVVREIWKGALKSVDFTDSDDFFALGGDSLDAIQVIAELQGKGHRVSANAFLSQPTVDALCRTIIEGERLGSEVQDPASLDRSSALFSAAQHKFLQQNFAQADHYNQTLLLESDARLSIEILRETMRVLQAWHPLLATRYWKEDGKWLAQRTDIRPVVGLSSLDSLTQDEAIGALIKTASQVYQSTLSLSGGKVFAAHLFTQQNGRDQLLLVAHHLSIDVISWRVILSDLSRLYRIIERKQALPEAPAVTPLSTWVAHLQAHRAVWEGDFAYWRSLSAALSKVPKSRAIPEDTDLEGAAETVWLQFSHAETEALLSDLPASVRTHFHTILLAAFLQIWHASDATRQDHTLVEIESHGRISFDETIDISRTAGWFTSSYPILIGTTSNTLAINAQAVNEQLSAVPNLGIAYGMLEGELSKDGVALLIPELCYNYLGEFHFGESEHPAFRPSRYSPGVARGAENARTHPLKLTARITKGQLLVDLSYNANRYTRDAMRALLASLHDVLVTASGRVRSDPLLHVDRGSSSGVLVNAPFAMYGAPSDMTVSAQRHYKKVLLTGASGYLGIYAFYALLTTSDSHIFCLVRDHAGQRPFDRLATIFAWYFPEVALSSFRDRFTVVAGDFDSERLGLSAATYSMLQSEVDAVYHFGADTRLFADQATLFRRNVEGTRQVLRLASEGRKKDFHHMSTLAVCGVNRDGKKRYFDENDLDIGQAFLNEYERSKFKAERLVHEFIAGGGNACIFRTGNVSGHSRTGRFQKNGIDNRLIQLIRAVIKIGKRPALVSETINLSPVDVVVQSIVRLSLEKGLSNRTFHIDSPWDMPLENVMNAVEAVSGELIATHHTDFAALFGAERFSRDRDLLLGNFWSTRAHRDIRFDATWSLACMEKVDCRFARLDEDWLEKFLVALRDDGAFADLHVGKVLDEK